MMPIASLESSAALEFYHNQLKIRFLNAETDSGIYKRADWLVNKLSTKIHSYFWLDEYEGKDDFSCYRKDEWASDFTSWHKSRIIPNTDVITEGEWVKVVDQVDRDLYHEIWNPGSEYAICSCERGENGNLCEHVCKVIQYHREKGFVLPSVSLLQYKQSLINMLKCPPANSSICDYAVSLAVWVNEQLGAQFAKSAQNGLRWEG
nr:zinc ion binding protein [Tanacetum cinerariifolium]